jgi:RNA-splicing ligase RtcB
MKGKSWNEKDAVTLLDEAPDSYKNIDVVMEAQKDLVKIDHTLHSILNYKGV